jgi:glycosyltransferase involved in cell wall biosynthesis
VRVLLGCGWYFPDAVGGTEVYVRGLAARLARAGAAVAVAAPRDGGEPARYVHEAIRVLRYPVSLQPSMAELQGTTLPQGFPEWERILEETAPDVVDFHSFTRGLGLAHMRVARAFGARVVLTVHLPGLLCARGTFLRFGRTPCDGDLDRRPCGACRLHGRGVPRPLAAVLARAPSWLAARAVGLPLPRWAVATLSSRAVQARHRAQLAEVVGCADHVVTGSRWLAEALRRNGLASWKLSLCPQGVEAVAPARRRVGAGHLRVGFIGRYDATKGLHVLVEAVRGIPATEPIECHVWGSGASPEAMAYRARIERLARGDARIRFHEAVADSREALAGVDVLAVPSVWMETGPLVVLEAFALGVPVVGSAIGGISERVRDGVNGVLVPHGDATALREALLALSRAPERLADLGRGIGAVRTMDAVAAETLALYARLTAPVRGGSPQPVAVR